MLSDYMQLNDESNLFSITHKPYEYVCDNMQIKMNQIYFYCVHTYIKCVSCYIQMKMNPQVCYSMYDTFTLHYDNIV